LELGPDGPLKPGADAGVKGVVQVEFHRLADRVPAEGAFPGPEPVRFGGPATGRSG
jgi:hypothetical protein